MLATEKAYSIEKRDRELAEIESRVKNIIAKKDAQVQIYCNSICIIILDITTAKAGK